MNKLLTTLIVLTFFASKGFAQANLLKLSTDSMESYNVFIGYAGGYCIKNERKQLSARELIGLYNEYKEYCYNDSFPVDRLKFKERIIYDKTQPNGLDSNFMKWLSSEYNK